MVKALREEFNTLKKATGDLLTLAATEKRDLAATEQEENDKRFNRMDAIKAQLAQHDRFAALAIGGDVKPGADVKLPTDAPGKDEHLASEGQEPDAGGRGTFSVEKFRGGLNHFARTGELKREVFAVTTGTGSGAYLPKQVLAPTAVRRLQNAFRAVLAAAGLGPIETDSLAAFSLPVADDSANLGQTPAEDASAGTELDPDNTGAIAISPVLYGSKQFWYSNSMVLAQGFDVLSYTVPMAQKRIEKSQESAWVTKLLAATVGKTTAAVAAITYAELLDWEHSLPAAYRPDSAFIVNDSLYRGLRGLVDTQARPIMDQDPTNVFAGKIHGRPVIVCDYLPVMATGNKSGALVSAEAIKIVDITNARLVRYVNYPGKPDQIGFEMFQNGDFGFVGQGVRLLRHA